MSRWSPGQRRPELPRWSGAECRDCALPVEYVTLDADPARDPGTRIAITRRVLARPEPGAIAARLIGTKMHGYRITRSRPLAAGYRAFPTHAQVCPDAPPPPFQQDSLLDQQEGTTP